jgi:hypothetical protein
VTRVPVVTGFLGRGKTTLIGRETPCGQGIPRHFPARLLDAIIAEVLEEIAGGGSLDRRVAPGHGEIH